MIHIDLESDGYWAHIPNVGLRMGPFENEAEARAAVDAWLESCN